MSKDLKVDGWVSIKDLRDYFLQDDPISKGCKQCICGCCVDGCACEMEAFCEPLGYAWNPWEFKDKSCKSGVVEVDVAASCVELSARDAALFEFAKRIVQRPAVQEFMDEDFEL